MINDVEAIKIIIMEAFYEYKDPLEYSEIEFNLIKQIDCSDNIKKLEKLINSKDYEKIREIIVQDSFYSNLKNKDYLPVQINFVKKIKNSTE